MSVELDPVELGFRRPFNREVSQVLRLRNPHSEPVAFKVKTTAPKMYCVRPNSGRIDAGGEVEVQVLLQAMKDEPPTDQKCRDKFLVQSVGVSAEQEFGNIPALWTQIEQTNKSSIQERKIRVNWLPADESSAGTGMGATPLRPNGVTYLESTPGDNPPTPDAVTPARGQTPAVGPVSKMEDRPSDSKGLSEIKEGAWNPAKSSSGTDYTGDAAGTGAGASSGSALGTLPTSADDIKSQLEQARAEIARLTSEAQEGLRRRNVPGTGSASTSSSGSSNLATAQHQASANGISLQITAGLCLISFLIAYLFF